MTFAEASMIALVIAVTGALVLVGFFPRETIRRANGQRPVADYIPDVIPDTSESGAAARGVSLLSRPAPAARHYTPPDLLDAIRQVESGGDCNAVGDGSKSLGAYQIGYAYFCDVYGNNAGWGNESSWRRTAKSDRLSRKTILRYWLRHERTALETGDFEALARVHNGGPNWRDKPEPVKARTLAYWRKVKAEMERQAAEKENEHGD